MGENLQYKSNQNSDFWFLFHPSLFYSQFANYFTSSTSIKKMSKLPREWKLYGESEVNENEVKNNAWIWNSNSEGKESSLKLPWLKTCADLPIPRLPITSTDRYIKLFSFLKRQNSNKNLSRDFTRQARLIWWDLVTRFDFIRIYFIRKQDIILFSTNKRGRLGRVHTFPLPPLPLHNFADIQISCFYPYVQQTVCTVLFVSIESTNERIKLFAACFPVTLR